MGMMNPMMMGMGGLGGIGYVRDPSLITPHPSKLHLGSYTEADGDRE